MHRQPRALLVYLAASGGVIGAICLTAVRADAPPDRYSRSDGLIRDTRTGLSWQQNIELERRTLSDADFYCLTLMLAGGGWRLPTKKELLTLVDPTRAKPAIDFSVFPNTPSDRFWSATLFVTTTVTGNAWNVDFYDGRTDFNATSQAYYVRCVRHQKG